MTKKKRIGRPPRADRTTVAKHTMNLRVTKEARERYMKAAAAEGLTLAAWIFALADAASGADPAARPFRKPTGAES